MGPLSLWGARFSRCLSAFIPQVCKYLLCTPAGTHCLLGKKDGKQMNQLISGGTFLKEMTG